MNNYQAGSIEEDLDKFYDELEKELDEIYK
jgi:hypothetical protein